MGRLFKILIEVQLAAEGSWAGPGAFLSHIMELGLCPEGRQGCDGPAGQRELSCRVGRNVGTGLVVKIPWRNRATVFCGLGERFRKVCLGPGTVFSSGGSSRGPLSRPQAGEGPGEED